MEEKYKLNKTFGNYKNYLYISNKLILNMSETLYGEEFNEECLEKELGKEAHKEFEEMQQGDVRDTLADNSKIISWIGDFEETSLSSGIKIFVKWYKSFY